MAVTKDYFLLYHGIQFHPEAGEKTLEREVLALSLDAETVPLLAVLLMVTRKEFEKFQTLDSFSDICKALHFPAPKTLKALHSLQYKISELLLKGQSDQVINLLRETFSAMASQELLKQADSKKLLSLFELSPLQTPEENKRKETFSFLEEKEALFKTVASLEKIFSASPLPDTRALDVLSELSRTLETQHFSLGITGVMNAGKSTMINALLGKEILGTSVVPETANLTVLKQNKKAQAKVHFWSKTEWEKIVSASETLEAMHDFVRETQEAFRENLTAYIQEPSKVLSVGVSELPFYTSAKDSGKRCNLVKYVELETDLDLLKENVEIVDTPGLDDPVIQREEITKSYIAKADMLFHLMNVSQSATAKDIEFLIDAVLYQNISRILIVITRADTVDEKVMEEVIAYTKKAIKEALILQNRERRVTDVLETLTFLPLSGKMALACRAESKNAEAKGYSLEKSGILALERYMKETLFGADSLKGRTLIASAKSKLLKVTQTYGKSLEQLLVLEAQSQEVLEAEYAVFQEKEKVTLEVLVTLREDLASQKKSILSYTKVLEHFLEGAFYTLQTVVRQRVVSDVRYSYEKTKKLPEDKRLKVIVHTAMKDGIIDIVRDYRYKMLKKFEEAEETFSEKAFTAIKLERKDSGLENLLLEAFSRGFLTQNFDLLTEQILKAVHQSKAKEIVKLDKNIADIVKKALDPIEKEIQNKAENVTRELTENFMAFLEMPLSESEADLEREGQAFERQIAQKKSSENTEEHSPEIHQVLKKIKKITAQLQGAGHGSV